MVDQVIEREFKAAGLDLLAPHHRQEPGIAVDLFVSCPIRLSCIARFDMDSLPCSLFPVGGSFCTASTSTPHDRLADFGLGKSRNRR